MRRLLAALVLAILFSAGSTAHVISPILPVDDRLFVEITPKPSLAAIVETRPRSTPSERPNINIKQPEPIVVTITPKPVATSVSGFKLDPNVSWYGPGFYGKRTACGLAYTKTIMGVANKTLPCGTKVTFKWGDRIVTVPVIDRGPYVAGRQWDLSGGLCTYLHHCFTGPIYYAVGSR